MAKFWNMSILLARRLNTTWPLEHALGMHKEGGVGAGALRASLPILVVDPPRLHWASQGGGGAEGSMRGGLGAGDVASGGLRRSMRASVDVMERRAAIGPMRARSASVNAYTRRCPRALSALFRACECAGTGTRRATTRLLPAPGSSPRGARPGRAWSGRYRTAGWRSRTHPPDEDAGSWAWLRSIHQVDRASPGESSLAIGRRGAIKAPTHGLPLPPWRAASAPPSNKSHYGTT